MKPWEYPFRKVREQVGMTAEETARAMHMEISAYGDYEEGRRDPTFAFVQKLAEVLNVDLLQLLPSENCHTLYLD